MTDAGHALRWHESTAEGVTMLRALASSDSRFPARDAMAVRMLGWSPAAALARIAPLRPLAAWISDRVSPGSYLFEVGRGLFMDEVITEAAADRASDVVLLGAGYDTRAYRFARRLPGLRFWEVDQPAMTDRKQAKLRRVLGKVPDDVRYVRVDFEHDDPGEALRDAGLDARSQVVWVWSGVSYYLTGSGVDAVLETVRAGSAPGSSLVFDYAFKALVDGDDRFHGAARTRRYVTRQGEQWRFGVDPEQLEEFLAARGFELVTALRPGDLEERYLSDRDGQPHGRSLGFMGLCHARVPWSHVRVEARDRRGTDATREGNLAVS